VTPSRNLNVITTGRIHRRKVLLYISTCTTHITWEFFDYAGRLFITSDIFDIPDILDILYMYFTYTIIVRDFELFARSAKQYSLIICMRIVYIIQCQHVPKCYVLKNIKIMQFLISAINKKISAISIVDINNAIVVVNNAWLIYREDQRNQCGRSVL